MSCVVIPKKHYLFSAACGFSLWYWGFDVVLSVLSCAFLVLVMISSVCSYGIKRLQLKPLQLSLNDELYHVPYGVKFLPNILNCGAKVIYSKENYEVFSVVVMAINEERWLFYTLRSCDDGSKVALSVTTRDGQLCLCWWRKCNSAIDDLEDRSSIVNKFGSDRYAPVADGYKNFISLGSVEYPAHAFCRYELLKRVSEVGDDSRWLLSWNYPENLRETFFGEDIRMEDVDIYPSTVQRSGIEPEEFSKAVKRLEEIKLHCEILALISALVLVFYLEVISE